MNPSAGPDLRDIHLPPAPGWWPPAPGWWLLAILALVLAYLVVRWGMRRARSRRWFRRVQSELEHIVATHAARPDRARLAADISQLLRRVARLIEPGAVSLRGEAWLGFLDARLPPERQASAPFRLGVGRALVDAPYRRNGDPAADFDTQSLVDLARDWIAHALPRRPVHG